MLLTSNRRGIKQQTTLLSHENLGVRPTVRETDRHLHASVTVGIWGTQELVKLISRMPAKHWVENT